LSLAIQGSRLVATRRRPTIPVQRGTDLMSVVSLTTGGTPQRVLPFNTHIKWGMIQNISTDIITLAKIEEDDPSLITQGEGFMLGKANSSGAGGGHIVLPEINFRLWAWVGSTTGSKITVMRLV